ncbi:MAG: ABC transporter permease [Candidatus Marinimicrobia bacterium]|nr:ABC transporter permease [Candidatus Neomarinimicrobiota bacterium]
MLSIFVESFRIALTSIFSNKSRSILTALGIIIGVLSVTLMGTLISGLDKGFDKSMAFLGKDVFSISRWEWFGDADWWEVRNRPRMRLEYVDIIKEKSSYAQAVAPVMQRGAALSRGELSTIGTQIFGTNTDYMSTITANIAQGRFFTEGEDRSGSRVTIIGNDIAENLFVNQDPVGEYLKIDGIKFRVIGVMEKQGKFLGLFSVDNQAIIPIGTSVRLFSRRGFIRISVKVPPENIVDAKDELYGIMRQTRGLKPSQKDDFAINQTEAFERQYNQIKFAIGGTGIFITILSLVVGGIGIMNIMFVSVQERTKEIGVRKAIGATKNMILTQFLMEAISICLIGGLIGLLMASGLSFVINKFFPSTMPLWLAFTSILLSVLVGVLSGVVPSYRAARLDPIDALRYE